MFPMSSRITAALVLAMAAAPTLAHEPPPVPSDYPSHSAVSGCTSLASLREGLQAYNVARLEVSDLLRELAADTGTSDESRAQLLGYAEQFEDLRRQLPDPDPDSNAFRNFDFQIGLTFASMTVFLNSRDPALSARFFRDRDDPQSGVGRYLAYLEQSRVRYAADLDRARADNCAG
jgi:hypothetical protein